MPSKTTRKKKSMMAFEMPSKQDTILLTLFISFIVGLGIFVKYDEKYLLENGIEYKGVISESGGKSLKVSYEIEGIEYIIGSSQPFHTLENGEVFYIKVDPKDSKHVIVEYWKPFISKSDFNVTESLGVSTFFIDNDFKFYYKVNNTEYGRYQRPPPNFDSKILKTDKPFRVLYKRSDPYVAYLLLE
jgi:hypothetical protein